MSERLTQDQNGKQMTKSELMKQYTKVELAGLYAAILERGSEDSRILTARIKELEDKLEDNEVFLEEPDF